QDETALPMTFVMIQNRVSAVALSEADDLAVGRGDDDLALGDGRGGRHGRGGFVFPHFLAAGEIEPVDAAVVGADEYAAIGDRRRRTVRVSPDGTPQVVIRVSVREQIRTSK